MVLAYSKHPEKPPIPVFCTEVLTKLLISRKAESLGHDTEESLPFHIQETDLAELIDG